MNKMNKLLTTLKLDDHHKMERFGVLFIVLSVILVSLTAVSFKKHLDNSKIQLGARAVYTTQTTWSRTGQNVQVVDVYRDSNFTKAFVLVKMNSDEVKKISTDAQDYQMFLSSDEGITTSPSGTIYVFGNTGYMGYLFVDKSGFEPALYDIIVRNYNRLTSDSSDRVYDDNSFNKYNQIRIYANFAGSDAKVVDFLDKDEPSLTDMYADILSHAEEEPVRQELNNTLIKMNDTMSLINEYGRRLEDLGIVVPPLPRAIANDYITDDVALTANNPVFFDESMIDDANSIISSDDYNVTLDTSAEEGEESKYVNSNKLYLVTDFVFPGGYQYNYQDMKLTDHYLNTLTGDLTFKQMVARKTEEKSSYSSDLTKMYGSSYYSKWYYTDGTEFDMNSNIDLTDDKVIKSAINDYTSAVNSLYSLKESYQTSGLYELMYIEANAEASTIIFSVNTDEDVLVIY